MNTKAPVHKEYEGREVRIPPNSWNGNERTGTVHYAGWDDWYIVRVDGQDYCRENADEIKRYLIEGPR